ncbi:unnamed protein product [Ectocarpus sp. 8 AP-2014]
MTCTYTLEDYSFDAVRCQHQWSGGKKECIRAGHCFALGQDLALQSRVIAEGGSGVTAAMVLFRHIIGLSILERTPTTHPKGMLVSGAQRGRPFEGCLLAAGRVTARFCCFLSARTWCGVSTPQDLSPFFSLPF